MTREQLQGQCQVGQDLLMQTEYIEAERVLAAAADEAWAERDFDTLHRVYMPLQEARRQVRQRCGEGIVRLDLIAENESDDLSGQHVVENYSHGQLLVAGWGTIEPAVTVRRLAREHGLYLETFLAAVYPIGTGRAVVVTPLEDVALPTVEPRSIDDLIKRLPAHCLVSNAGDLHPGPRKGDWRTYAEVMALWERLHTPFLAAADMQVDPIQRIAGYLKTIRVDRACELAHQKLSDVAREIERSR